MKEKNKEDELKELVIKEQPDNEMIPVQPNIEDCFMALMKN
jgi:hypothetical protein